MNAIADDDLAADLPVVARRFWADPGTVGVTVMGSDTDVVLGEMQQEAMKILEASGVPSSPVAPQQIGSAATGVFFWLAVSFIVENAGEMVVAGGLSTAAKWALKEKKRREVEALDKSLPAVTIRLSDHRGSAANLLQLLKILEDDLESKLAMRYPNRRYKFTVASSTPVVPAVVVTMKARDLSHSVRRTISKLVVRYEGADRISLYVKRNPFGKTIVQAEVHPPVPPFENPHWNGVSIL